MSWYFRLPLFSKILAFAVIGWAIGWLVGPQAGALKPVTDTVLQLLRMLATPLIFLSVVRSVLTADVGGKRVVKLAYLLARTRFSRFS